MAVCLLNNDILKSNTCGYSLRQIVELYVANFSDITGTTIGKPADGDGTEIKTITLKSSAKFYKIEPADESASYSDELQVGNAGAKYRLVTVNWTLGGTYSAEMADIVDALSLGRYFVVAKLTDGSYVAFGRLVGLTSTSANLQGASDATAEQGILVTMTANTTEVSLPLSEDAVQTVIGAAD